MSGACMHVDLMVHVTVHQTPSTDRPSHGGDPK